MEKIDRSEKPHFISCLGDIALAIGGNFERYLYYAMQMLIQASQIRFEELDAENIEYQNTLRDSILGAYTGILNSLAADKKANLLLPYLEKMVGFFDLIAKDEHKDENVLKEALSLIGDLASHYGPQIKALLHRPSIAALLSQGGNSKNEAIAKTAQQSKEYIQHIFSGN